MTPPSRSTSPSAPPEPLLSVRGLTVEFATERGYLPVVSDVSFDVPEGQVIGTEPEAGTTLAPGGPVTIVRSAGS